MLSEPPKPSQRELELLTGWIHAVATVNPLTLVFKAGRSLIAGDPITVAAAFAVAVALIVAFGGWALSGLRRAEAAGG